MSLNNQHVVITGAAAGIGLATAKVAMAHGARVTSLDIVAADDNGITHLPCDVSQPDDWTQAAARLAPVDHLFLNAGVMSAPPGASDDDYAFNNVDLPSYRRLVGVNVDGVVFGLKAMLPNMGEGASVVVTASLAGVHGYSHDPLYAMTKHAVVGLVKSLVPVVAKRGVRLIALCPDRVDTALLPKDKKQLDCLQPSTVADDVLQLFARGESGQIWVHRSGAETMSLLTGSSSGAFWRRWRQTFVARLKGA